jgi:branched-chain amino acid transport system ATP-binding protein
MPLLEIKSLNKSFGRLQVIEDLNFDLPKGQLTSIIGPNGAGKTTLFNLITGRFSPDSGVVLFKGRNITALRPHMISQMGLARSFQITNLFPQMTVHENVWLAGQSRLREKISLLTSASDHPELHLKTLKVLESVGLLAQKERLAGSLSHGEQRHLEIAMALATSPELLLLDEPTSGMSPTETAETIKLIDHLRQDVSILFIEHDMDVVMSISERIIVLNYGKKIAEGPPEEIERDPEVRRVYLGEL